MIAEDRSSRRGWGSDDSLSRSVEDEFIANLFRKGYRVAARSDVKKVWEEGNFQRSGLTEADGARLGRMLNVPAVLIVTINGATVNSRTTGYAVNGVPQYVHTAMCKMSVRLISVEKAEILGIARFESSTWVPNADDVSGIVLYVARVLAESIPGRSNQ